MMIDKLGQRYGRLPSEVLDRATTLDLAILDIALTNEKHMIDKQNPNYVPEVSVEELMKIKERNG